MIHVQKHEKGSPNVYEDFIHILEWNLEQFWHKTHPLKLNLQHCQNMNLMHLINKIQHH